MRSLLIYLLWMHQEWFPLQKNCPKLLPRNLPKRRFFTIQTNQPLHEKKESLMKSPVSRSSRRNFLLAVGAGGVATAAAVAGRHPKAQAGKAQAVVAGKGYQLTEHVRKYYETTKV
jgi:hypothetical protein